ILDTFSPVFSSTPFPLLRIGTLCASASCRALCGIVGGGSKAAITLHFATPINGVGDVGDLNAKDASKETILALFGVLVRSIANEKKNPDSLTDTARDAPGATHKWALAHLQQRAGKAWNLYRSSTGNKAPSPAEVSTLDNILDRPDVFYDENGRRIGNCKIGSSFSDVFNEHVPSRLLEIFAQERYLLWYDPRCLYFGLECEEQDIRGGPMHLHIVLKEGYSGTDQLKAWCHAAELCRTLPLGTRARETLQSAEKISGALDPIDTTLRSTSREFPNFLIALREAGWNVDDIVIVAGSPKAILVGIEPKDEMDREDKKFR
ncbi:hypothetical protein C0992_002615, partial [Termitomyces sp. T32_za158]